MTRTLVAHTPCTTPLRAVDVRALAEFYAAGKSALKITDTPLSRALVAQSPDELVNVEVAFSIGLADTAVSATMAVLSRMVQATLVMDITWSEGRRERVSMTPNVSYSFEPLRTPAEQAEATAAAEAAWDAALEEYTADFKAAGFEDRTSIDFSDVDPEAIAAMGEALRALQRKRVAGVATHRLPTPEALAAVRHEIESHKLEPTKFYLPTRDAWPSLSETVRDVLRNQGLGAESDQLLMFEHGVMSIASYEAI